MRIRMQLWWIGCLAGLLAGCAEADRPGPSGAEAGEVGEGQGDGEAGEGEGEAGEGEGEAGEGEGGGDEGGGAAGAGIGGADGGRDGSGSEGEGEGEGEGDEPCDPAGPVLCDGVWAQRCLPDGSGYVRERCEDGAVCQAGRCVPVRANVVLLVDTSGSMNRMVSDGSDPADCAGEGCPPWDFPQCDDPAAPETRLGRTKVALQALVASEAAQAQRIALQRFPQTDGLLPVLIQDPSCGAGGWHSVHHELMGPGDARSLELDFLQRRLPEIMAAPIGEDGETDTAEILRWTNFVGDAEPTDRVCVQGQGGHEAQCAPGFCYWPEQLCYERTEPELRAGGMTPLGRSLFYAGEYFRHFVVKEGAPCVADVDCGSPDYRCVEGACRDPLVACRPNVVVVFSDGAETEENDPASFFNPRVQSKRFHYGLGCVEAGDCLSGARCVDGLCRPPNQVDLPERLCVGPPADVEQPTEIRCEEDAQCPEHICGSLGQVCPGSCADSGFAYDDLEGFDTLSNDAGHRIALTVHVVDASGGAGGNSLLAEAGGGTHASVDFADPDLLVERFLTVLRMKADVAACGP